MKHEFDQYSADYEGTVAQSVSFSGLPHDFFMSAKADLLAELFAERFGPAMPVRLLDVGCGVGRAHPWLRPIVATLAGTDPSSESIDRARIDNPGVTYSVGDGRKLEFDDDSFDAVVAICALHHVPTHDWSAFVAEMRRVTRPGGLVIIIEHNPWNPLTRLAVARCPLDADAVLLGATRAAGLLDHAGCGQIESRHFLLLPSPNRLARRVERSCAGLPLGAQYAAIGQA
jgi:SAM-dependent methyltransferase